MQTSLVLNALLMAVWRRKPQKNKKAKVIVHSDQDSQFTSAEWQSFLSTHNLEASMNRRGNCYDNAVVESFFHLLKTERIRRKTYKARALARQDVFDYIEMFYNSKRKHGNNGMLSPVQYERQQKMKVQGVYKIWGTSVYSVVSVTPNRKSKEFNNKVFYKACSTFNSANKLRSWLHLYGHLLI